MSHDPMHVFVDLLICAGVVGALFLAAMAGVALVSWGIGL